MGASCGSIYLFFPCARSAIYPSRDLKFSRYPLLLTLMQLTSTGPTFVAPKINIQETQQKYLFPNVMTQLLTNIHRPYCAWPHRKLLFYRSTQRVYIHAKSQPKNTSILGGSVNVIFPLQGRGNTALFYLWVNCRFNAGASTIHQMRFKIL